MKQPEFHMISNGKLPLAAFAAIAGNVHKWVTAIHIREKLRSAKEIMGGVEHLINKGVPSQKICINDRVDVASALGTRGVHLAYHSLDPWIVKKTFPHLRVGSSVHDVEEAKVMEQQGVDYLFFGHIFQSLSKPGKPEQGLAKLAEVTHSVSTPVIAIGGITPDNVPAVIQAGAAGIAVLSGIVQVSDPVMMAKKYARALYGEEFGEECHDEATL